MHSVRNVVEQSPVITFESADELHDRVGDFAQYLLKHVARGYQQPLFAGPRELTTDDDVVQYFVSEWLPQLLQPFEGESTFHVKLADLCIAVESFRNAVAAPAIVLDSGRWRMTQHHPSLWIPRSKDEEALSLPLLHWLQDHGSAQMHGPQKVLHMGTDSGYVTDLLMVGLGGNMTSLLCVDHSAHALSATERTLQDHWRLKRSSHIRKRVEMLECESLPTMKPQATPATSLKGTPTTAKPGATNLAAAARRRALGRAHRTGAVLEQDRLDRTESSPSSAEGGSLLMSSVDLLCVSAAPVSNGFPAWSPLEALKQHAVLQNTAPYATVGGMHRWMGQVLGPSSPLRQGGVICVLLPFSLHCSPREIISAQLSAANGNSVGGKSSAWDIVASRRSPLCASVSAAESMLSGRSARIFLNRCGPQDPLQQHRFYREMVRHVTRNIGSEFIVFSDSAMASLDNSNNRMPKKRSNGGAWEDSFEHQNYLPREGPTNPLHWSNVVDSFPHLESDAHLQLGDGSTSTALLSPEERQRLLAHRNDASAVLGRSPHIISVNAAAERNLQSIFGHELRTRRQKKAKKLAFASSRNVEWYLDEKVVKSDAAKVDVLNEVLKKLGAASTPN